MKQISNNVSQPEPDNNTPDRRTTATNRPEKLNDSSRKLSETREQCAEQRRAINMKDNDTLADQRAKTHISAHAADKADTDMRNSSHLGKSHGDLTSAQVADKSNAVREAKKKDFTSARVGDQSGAKKKGATSAKVGDKGGAVGDTKKANFTSTKVADKGDTSGDAKKKNLASIKGADRSDTAGDVKKKAFTSAKVVDKSGAVGDEKKDFTSAKVGDKGATLGDVKKKNLPSAKDGNKSGADQGNIGDSNSARNEASTSAKVGDKGGIHMKDRGASSNIRSQESTSAKAVKKRNSVAYLSLHGKSSSHEPPIFVCAGTLQGWLLWMRFMTPFPRTALQSMRSQNTLAID